MYNIMLVSGVQEVIWPLHTLWNDHRDKSSNLSPYKVTTVLLTIFLMLYITSRGLFYNWRFVPLPPLHLFCTLLHALPSANHPFVLCIYESVLFVYLFCILDSTHKWDHTVFFFLWLISLSVIPFRFIHVAANGKIEFFLWLSNIPLYTWIYICTTSSLTIHPSVDT